MEANEAADADVLAPPVDAALLNRIVQRIVAHVPDACVVLFGSHAYGQPHGRSDVDLLIVTAAGDEPYRLAGELYGRLSPREIALDLVVMSPERFRIRRSRFDPFMSDVLSKGRVLHGCLP
jgi:predicted nucleotidyltransferase